jgi:hypothetical protein
MFCGLDKKTIKLVFYLFRKLIRKKIKTDMTLAYINSKNKYKKFFDLEKMIAYASWNLNIFPNDQEITRESVIRILIIQIAEYFAEHLKTQNGTIGNFVEYHEKIYGCLYREFSDILLLEPLYDDE